MRIIFPSAPEGEKEVKCNSCKSKLAYVQRDVITCDERGYEEEFYINNKDSSKKGVEYIICPICHNHIILNKN